MNIALCGGLARVTGKRCTRSTILEIAKNVEAIVIRVPTGWQDYFPRSTAAPIPSIWSAMA